MTDADRIDVTPLDVAGFYRITVHYGFMEDPDIPAAMRLITHPDLNFDLARTTYFLGRESILSSTGKTTYKGMAVWREQLFARMTHNATSAAAYFCLPPDRVVELGSQVEI